MTSAEVQRKLVAALMRAAGRGLDTREKAQAFVARELDFAVSHTFGGNSSCVQIAGRDAPVHAPYLLCDLGSGARVFANQLLAERGPAGHVFHVFMSHVHWDHIMGFPFFMPAYIPGNQIYIYGCHETLEEAFRRQNSAPSFPVDFSRMGAAIEFTRLEPGREYRIADFRVRAMRQHHGGDSYGYRFERSGKTVIYSTDSEHKLADLTETHRFVQFFRDADLVVFDAMYSLADSISVKADWGHSSNIVGVDLCHMAGVRHLCMFHHEPGHGDEAIARVLRETQRYEQLARRDRAKPLHVSAAYDGMEIVP